MDPRKQTATKTYLWNSAAASFGLSAPRHHTGVRWNDAVVTDVLWATDHHRGFRWSDAMAHEVSQTQDSFFGVAELLPGF